MPSPRRIIRTTATALASLGLVLGTAAIADAAPAAHSTHVVKPARDTGF